MTNKEYIIHGLSRSGNHAIIYWIIHNIVDSVEELGGGVYIDKGRKLCFINNFNTYEGQLKLNFPHDLFPIVIKSYEDTEFTKYTSAIILRDFGNLLASRYAKYYKNICLNNKYICDLLRLIEVWKQHTVCPKKTILYNQWLTSKNYRDKISLEILGIDNIIDRTDYVSSIGDGSSFNNTYNKQENTEYLTRYKKIKFPQYMIDYILKDEELININKQIFDIDLKEILC